MIFTTILLAALPRALASSKVQGNVPRPEGEVVVKACARNGCKGWDKENSMAYITNAWNTGEIYDGSKMSSFAIPVGQQWIDKGQASETGCCDDKNGACNWCVKPIPKVEQRGPPKCFVKVSGTGNGNCQEEPGKWIEDTWGRDNADSWKSYDQCMKRKRGHDRHCGTKSHWCFAHGDSSTCGGTELKVCHWDSCTSTLSNSIPQGETWEQVSKVSETGCCRWWQGPCDICRSTARKEVEEFDLPPQRVKRGKKVCWKDKCQGTRTNPIRNGQKWLRTGQHSYSGCCAWGISACDWCVPPSIESQKESTSNAYSASIANEDYAIYGFALVGLGTMLLVLRSAFRSGQYKSIDESSKLEI